MPRKTKAKPPAKVGRPSIKDTIPQDKLKLLYESGWTDRQVAQLFGITEQTIVNWRNADPKFFESINDWKQNADKQVTASLYQRAIGYSHPEIKAQWVNDENGGRWEYAQLTKHYPPDPTAMIFWLKNRDREHWSDRQESKIDHSITVNVVSFGQETQRIEAIEAELVEDSADESA